ncbi:helix-turn-helix domain-containing protein [Marinicrinis lubricantis]|uniref:Helix-turn-helix domain-containing protein n=1 Tax=Marinicrinis lubricantis TaxID=2086470 RepID=A0ABW1IPZ3_9BACL
MFNGNRLRKLRKERGLTAKEFGQRFQLAESTISGYENGKREPDSDKLNSFADFFGVTTDYLLGRTDDPERTSASEPPQHRNAPSVQSMDEIKEEPEVQFLMRAREDLSPKAYAKFIKLMEEAKKAFEEEEED